MRTVPKLILNVAVLVLSSCAVFTPPWKEFPLFADGSKLSIQGFCMVTDCNARIYSGGRTLYADIRFRQPWFAVGIEAGSAVGALICDQSYDNLLLFYHPRTKQAVTASEAEGLSRKLRIKLGLANLSTAELMRSVCVEGLHGGTSPARAELSRLAGANGILKIED